jgi:hypothetical protein
MPSAGTHKPAQRRLIIRQMMMTSWTVRAARALRAAKPCAPRRRSQASRARVCRARRLACYEVAAGRAYTWMAVFLRLIPVVFYLLRLSRTRRARMLYARAREYARSPEGRELLAHAQRVARDLMRRQRLRPIVPRARQGSRGGSA